MNLNIEDIITEEQFKELSLNNGGHSFDGKLYKLKNSYYFEKSNNQYKVVSTFESRIEKQSDVNIIGLSNKYSKSYYG